MSTTTVRCGECGAEVPAHECGVERVAVTSIAPGDLVVLETSQPLRREDVERLREHWREHTGVQGVVLESPVRIAGVLRVGIPEEDIRAWRHLVREVRRDRPVPGHVPWWEEPVDREGIIQGLNTRPPHGEAWWETVGQPEAVRALVRLMDALFPDPHEGHGQGREADGPEHEDCPCRATSQQVECAAAGCGFCAAEEES